MAKENRMSREEYLKKCEEVEDTAYAQEGNPQTFGNELLLQNINAFGTEIARTLVTKVRTLKEVAVMQNLGSLDLNTKSHYYPRRLKMVKRTLTIEKKIPNTTRYGSGRRLQS